VEKKDGALGLDGLAVAGRIVWVLIWEWVLDNGVVDMVVALIIVCSKSTEKVEESVDRKAEQFCLA